MTNTTCSRGSSQGTRALCGSGNTQQLVAKVLVLALSPRAFFGLKNSCFRDPSGLTLSFGLSWAGAANERGVGTERHRQAKQTWTQRAHQQAHAVGERHSVLGGGHVCCAARYAAAPCAPSSSVTHRVRAFASDDAAACQKLSSTAPATADVRRTVRWSTRGPVEDSGCAFANVSSTSSPPSPPPWRHLRLCAS